MRYSLIGVGLSFAAGIAVSLLLPAIPPYFLCAAAAGAAIAALLLSRWRRGLLAGLLVSIALLGAMREQGTRLSFDLLYQRIPILHEVTGTVVSYPRLGDGYVTFVLAPDNIPGRIRVTWFHGEKGYDKIVYGDRLRLSGICRVPPRFPDFDYRTHLARRGIFATMSVGKDGAVKLPGIGKSRWIRAGDLLRQRLMAKLERILPEEEAGLACGLLFGDRTGLSDSLAEAFRRTGLMHVLAVSGLHLGIFLAGLWFFLRAWGLRPAFTYPLVGAAVLFALWVVGPRVSLTRAALLFAFLGLGSVLADLGLILRRWVNPFQSLAAAGIVILALRPSALVEVGFQLSFGATAAILAVFDPGFRVTEWVDRRVCRAMRGRWPLRYGLLLLVTSGAAQAGTAPFLAYHFGMFYPVSLIGNLIIIPLATLGLWSGLAALLLPPAPLFKPLGTLFSAVLHAVIVVVKWFGGLPFSALDVPDWMGVWIGGIVVYLFLLAVYSRERSSYTSYSTSIASSPVVGSLRGGRRK